MGAQRSNSVLIFVAVLVAAVIVVYAIVGRQPSTPQEEIPPTQPEQPEQAQPAQHEIGEPEVTEIDQTTDTTNPPPEIEADPATPTPEAPTTLLAAAEAGDIDALHAMIAAGADVNQPNEEGVTPLMTAAGEGHVDAVFVLLNSGADMNLRDQTRRSARDYALARFDESGQTIARILGEAAGPPPARDPGEK